MGIDAPIFDIGLHGYGDFVLVAVVANSAPVAEHEEVRGIVS